MSSELTLTGFRWAHQEHCHAHRDEESCEVLIIIILFAADNLAHDHGWNDLWSLCQNLETEMHVLRMELNFSFSPLIHSKAKPSVITLINGSEFSVTWKYTVFFLLVYISLENYYASTLKKCIMCKLTWVGKLTYFRASYWHQELMIFEKEQ